MLVLNDPPQFFGKKNQNGRQKTKWPPKTELSITQSIFKLEAPDFGSLKKWPPKTKLTITQSIFKLGPLDFAS